MSEIILQAKNGDMITIEFPDGPCNLTAAKNNQYPVDISEYLKIVKLDIKMS